MSKRTSLCWKVESRNSLLFQFTEAVSRPVEVTGTCIESLFVCPLGLLGIGVQWHLMTYRSCLTCEPATCCHVDKITTSLK